MIGFIRIVMMVNSCRLLEERFALGLRLEAISLRRLRLEV
jgi:hypothetical protein